MSSHKKENDTRTRILQATWNLMEERKGRNVRMSDIAKAASLSRQALYLHFPTRIALMGATTKYVDDVLGLEQRLSLVHTASNATEILEAYVEVWGNYIPEISGLAKALLSVRDNDEAAAIAWDDCMADLRLACSEIITALKKEGILTSAWSEKEAIEIAWTLLSYQNWEQLTVACAWSNPQYVSHMKSLLKSTLIDRDAVART